MDNQFSSRGSQSERLRDWLESLDVEKPNLPDAHLSSNLTKNEDNTPPASSGNNQKQHIERKANEELVKNMSNLPSFVEKGQNRKVKALNVGVLDWRRLEKWQHNRRRKSDQSGKYSPTSSNATSFFTTDGSFNQSSRGSCSPAHQRMRRQTLQSHLNASPNEGYSQGVKSSVENVENLEDLKAASSYPLEGQRSTFGMYQSFSKIKSENIIRDCKKKNKEPQNIPETETSQHGNGFVVASQLKGKAKIQDGESTSGMEKLQEPYWVVNHDYDVSVKTGVLLPMDDHESSATANGNVGRTSCFKYSSAKSGSEKAAASSCFENSSDVKPYSKSRSISIPWRRLLDPLLKPKAVNSHHSAELSERDSTSRVKASTSSNGQVESSTAHSVKVNFHLTSCRTINVDDSLCIHSEKHRSSTIQALLQITIKNGLPLFTFADDNNSSILAAMMRRANASKKDVNCWIYTFFNVHEVKKKSGWINPGSKGRNHGYIPNVIAQMTVSDAQLSNSVRHDSEDELCIREFVLSAADQQISDPQSNDELAAIVVKFPVETPKILKSYIVDSSVNGLGKLLPEVRGCLNSMDNKENDSDVRSRDLDRITVILPGGVHGLPRKGEPSSLVKRWISGGLCDCGGWDLGCRMRVLSSQTKLSSRLSSSKAQDASDRFKLFPQGEICDDRPVFSLSRFKDSIFSVEFNSSVTFLQAFSICLAVLSSGKPYELSELSKLFEGKSSGETTSEVNGVQAYNQIQAEISANNASQPPLSPVERV